RRGGEVGDSGGGRDAGPGGGAGAARRSRRPAARRRMAAAAAHRGVDARVARRAAGDDDRRALRARGRDGDRLSGGHRSGGQAARPSLPAGAGPPPGAPPRPPRRPRARPAPGAPIVPAAVIGAEEVHPVLWRFEGLGRLLGIPALPVTPAPIPLPTKWTVHVGEPLEVPRRAAAGLARDRRAMRALRIQVRE